MMIKDLEMNKALDREAQTEVRGGSAYAGGQFAPQTVFSGGIQSPTVANNAPINAPVALDNDVRSYLSIDVDTANVLASAGTVIWQ